ncbi:AAA family ATPase [Sulfurovum sp. zt1-1]|uniref:endopeptidase La n=1 Tax=Sulfurovum zhangzhouensis TaxID=3019067 RepID=A0ABT7QXV3_9BACT|nr:AAA family ATPase [Sulfurovum zhangzhouensis]MDM5271670.1 AAA family ATPase [Sulfurovum zhangzhouensis]
MKKPLDVSALYQSCDSSLFVFHTTNELEPLEHPVGQERALDAIDFGTKIAQDGYNIFAMGPSGSGKHSVVMSYLEQKAGNEPAPSDWCYVNNFKDPRSPIAIELPPGKALPFRDNIDELIELLKTVLPAVFESSGYTNEREALNQKFMDEQTDIFRHLQEEAIKRDVQMNISSSSRITFVPVIDGKVLSPEEFKAIKGEKKEKIANDMSEFEGLVKEALRKITELNKVHQKELNSLNKKITKEAVHSIIDEVRQRYAENEKIKNYLNEMEKDIVRHVQDFLVKPEEMGLPSFMMEFYTSPFERYKVNLFISHEQENNAPVIYEDNPVHQNLIGRIEHASHMGALVTNFSMIKPGALHKANGGYLVLDARKLLMKPFAYEELKRVLRAKELRIESLAKQYAFVSTTTLEPEPIPLDIKVVLVGERYLYYILYHYDPEFKELFKVTADFEDELHRNEENHLLYARMIGTIAKRHDLLALTPQATARVIEQCSRDVSDAYKLSTHLHTLADLLKEADFWAQKNTHKVIEAEDIEQTLAAQKARVNRVQLKLYEQIDEGMIMIDVSGSKVGQINALTFISLGGHEFGIPSRISATTRIGKGEIIDIQRKVELGGPIHSKGVMILSAYLGSRYAADLPLSIAASLVFEQTYGRVEGDSASSTELYALLSSLSGIPIKQNIAVTGSVNQFGEVQPVGGINEKVEGFFDICMHHDPKASYGVIIPEANVKHLMLKNEVLVAAKEGKFSIYAVKNIDEGITILTGVKAGEMDDKGEYPATSVNGKVLTRLKELSQKAKEYAHGKKK